MNPEIKAKWVAALRSGNYPQTKKVLRDSKGFCCYGVLCDLYAQEHLQEAEWTSNSSHYVFGMHLNNTFYNRAVMPPVHVFDWADGGNIVISDQGEPVSLDALNDEGVSFDEIANLIEKYL